jgi:hypothetical protein
MAGFPEPQRRAVLRCYALADRDERKARLRTVLALASELEKIRAVSVFGTLLHEQTIEAVIEGDWRAAAEINGWLGESERELPHCAKAWEGFRAVVLAACAAAAEREAGRASRPD